MTFRFATIALSISLTACAAMAPGDDAGSDAGGSDVGGAAVDAGVDAAVPVTAVSLTYRGHTETLPRALFGYERTAGVITETYVELSRGGDDGCPTESSATPDQILTITGYAGTTPGTQDTGITTAFFDFEGLFRDEIAPATSSATTVELRALDEAAGTASGVVTVTFDEGSASGPFTATHCDSLDTEASE